MKKCVPLTSIAWDDSCVRLAMDQNEAVDGQ